MSDPASAPRVEEPAAIDELARTGDERVAAIEREAVLSRVNQQLAGVRQRRRAGKATRLARARARALGVTWAQRTGT